jgi:metal-sulfur cluster biosynthetic enzyme
MPINTASLRDEIMRRLSQVIDPETGVDVVRMNLIDELAVDPEGRATYTLRPSSLTCPLAAVLAYMVRNAVKEVPGVTSQHITIADHVDAEELTEHLNTLE